MKRDSALSRPLVGRMCCVIFALTLLATGAIGWAADIAEIGELREMYLDTALVTDGAPSCIIAVPDQIGYGEAATRLAAAIKEVCGVALEPRRAGEIPEETVKTTNIIALGVFANNPVVEKLYHRSLVSCDWSWPKGEAAYVIRTVHNPWLTGKNVVYIGSVTPAGCEAAVDRFIEILKESPGGSVGPLIEIAGAGAPPTEDAVANYLKQIEAETSSRTMGGLAARYVDAYFTTGHPQWAKVFLAAMRKLDKLQEAEGTADDVRTCRYIFNQYDSIDEGPAFTDQERLELANIFHRFANRLLYAKQMLKASAMPHGNNWNASGAGFAGMYFTRYFPELPIGKQILDNMDTYYEPNMINWKVNEDCPGYGNITLTGNYDWALNRPDWRFFDTDCLRKMADYDMLITTNLGQPSGFGDASGLRGSYLVNAYSLASWLYKDGRYLWWWEHHGRGPNRYWVPPEIIARQRPDDLLGVNKAPLAEWIYDRQSYEKTRNFPIADCFDKVSFRSGFDPQDQYVCFSGFGYGFHSHADANAIINYSDKGQTRLYDDGYMIRSLSEHNTVTILKDGWAGWTPELAQVTAEADFRDVGIFESRLDDYNGVYWDRAVIWPKGRYFLVVDDLQCIDPAQYSFQCIWRTQGNAKLQGRRWTSEKDPGRFNLVVASDAALSEKESAGTSLNAKPFALTEARALVQAAKSDMGRGDSYQFANLFYTANLEGDVQHVDIYRAGEDSTTYIINDDGKLAAAGINHASALPGVVIRAAAFYVTADTLTAAAATRLRVRGPLLTSNMPVNVQVNLVTGEAQMQATEQVEVTYSSADGEKTETFEAGTHALKLQPPDKLALRAIAEALDEGYRRSASAAAGEERRIPGTGEKLTKLWEYNDFHAYTNVAPLPGNKIKANLTAMTPEQTGVASGTEPLQLLSKDGNLMFPDGESLVLDIELVKPVKISEIIVNSRQLLTFNGGCGVSRINIWLSDDNFAGDKRLFGRRDITDPLQDAMVPYPLRVEKPVKGRYVRIECVPYTEAHNVYLDSVEISSVADKAEIALSGFHINAMQVADIDGDGREEIFLGGTDMVLHALSADGSALWRYPVAAAINDLTAVNSLGDGNYQIVAACDDKQMYSVKEDGSENFTVMPPPRTYARPHYRGVKPFTGRLVLATNSDIDNDGDAEIIIGSANWRAYTYDHNGELIWDECCWAHTPSAVTVCDLDGDGLKEVLMGNISSIAIQVYDSTGKLLRGVARGGATTALACADLDGNGKAELLVGDRSGRLWFQEWQGRQMPMYNTGSDVTAVAIADLNGDGKLESVGASRNYILYAFDSDGALMWQSNLLAAVRDIATGDVLGDDAPEIICACEDKTVKIVSAEGEIVAWYRGAGWMRQVAVCELDGNPATKEIAVACDDGSVYALQVTE